MADHVLEKGTSSSGSSAGHRVDGIVDRPALRSGVLVTNMHGLHGDSVPEAAIMLMLALGATCRAPCATATRPLGALSLAPV